MSLFCFANILSGSSARSEIVHSSLPQARYDKLVVQKSALYKQSSKNLEEDKIRQRNQFHVIQVYGEIKGGCSFASIATEIEIVHNPHALLFTVADRKVKKLRDDYLKVLKLWVSIARKMFKSLLSKDLSEDFTFESLTMGEQNALRGCIRVLHSRKLSDEYSQFVADWEQLTTENKNESRAEFYQKWFPWLNGKEFKEFRDGLQNFMQELWGEGVRLQSLQFNKQSAEEKEKYANRYAAEEWYTLVQAAVDNFMKNGGVSKDRLVVFGALPYPYGNPGEMICDRCTISVYNEVDGSGNIMNNKLHGTVSEDPSQGLMRVILGDRLFYEEGRSKSDLNVLICADIGVPREEKGKKVWDIMGHMMPMVKREDCCHVIFQGDKKSARGVSSNSFPVVVLDGENELTSDQKKIEETVNIIMLQEQKGTAGILRNEKNTLDHICPDRKSALGETSLLENYWERKRGIFKRCGSFFRRHWYGLLRKVGMCS